MGRRWQDHVEQLAEAPDAFPKVGQGDCTMEAAQINGKHGVLYKIGISLLIPIPSP